MEFKSFKIPFSLSHFTNHVKKFPSGEETTPQDEDGCGHGGLLGDADDLEAEIGQQRGDGNRGDRGVRGPHGHERVLESGGMSVAGPPWSA